MKMKGFAKALSNPRVPTERREQMLAELKNMLALTDKEELTPKMIEDLGNEDAKTENPGLACQQFIEQL